MDKLKAELVSGSLPDELVHSFSETYAVLTKMEKICIGMSDEVEFLEATRKYGLQARPIA
eukprot:4541946-Amphidinium_carterae.1